ncbi:MAG: HAD family phosphatase [Pseudomonadota bacterium]
MSLPRRPRAVIFDMDGLIVDTEVLYREAMITAVAARGYDMPPTRYMETIGMPGDAARNALRDFFEPDFDLDSLWNDAKRRFHELTRARRYLKAGVEELLDVLDAVGTPRAIATSSGHDDVRLHLSSHGLVGRFDAIVAQGDYPRGKPNPDPYLKAADLLAVEPTWCLALEDSHNGVRAASEAGMMTVMIPDLLHPTEEMHRLCVRIADDLHEVRDLIEMFDRTS